MILRLTDTGRTPRQKTEVRVLWDETCLYVAFHCRDDDVWATIAERDGPLWEEKVVEVFVDDDRDGITYLEYEINPLNALVDLYVVNRTGRREDVKFMLDWNSDGIRHAVTVDGDPTQRGTPDRSWTVECAIPFTDFATAPASRRRTATRGTSTSTGSIGAANRCDQLPHPQPIRDHRVLDRIGAVRRGGIPPRTSWESVRGSSCHAYAIRLRGPSMTDRPGGRERCPDREFRQTRSATPGGTHGL